MKLKRKNNLYNIQIHNILYLYFVYTILNTRIKYLPTKVFEYSYEKIFSEKYYDVIPIIN